MNNLFSLDKKVALVTGGYGHLGKAMTLALAEAGASTYVLARSREKYEAAFPGEGDVKIHFMETDIADSGSIRRAFESVSRKEGKIDILVNNAHYLKGRAPLQLSDADWAHTTDGVLGCIFKAIREVAPYMENMNYGKIINIASMYGVVSPDFSLYEGREQYLNPPHYGASKAGVIQLTKYYASFLGRKGINVNVITPGPFPREQIREDAEFIDRLKARNPLKRIGYPEDIKGAIVFLASDASSFITGHNLVIDGGWTTW